VPLATGTPTLGCPPGSSEMKPGEAARSQGRHWQGHGERQHSPGGAKTRGRLAAPVQLLGLGSMPHPWPSLAALLPHTPTLAKVTFSMCQALC
jgi:hypothetical protein